MCSCNECCKCHQQYTCCDRQQTSIIHLEPKEREPVNARIVVTKDRVEQAVSAFETACSAEGIRYKVKQKENQTAWYCRDLLRDRRRAPNLPQKFPAPADRDV